MKEPTDEELKEIGIDFDLTLVGNTGYPEYELTGVIEGAREFIDTLWERI